MKRLIDFLYVAILACIFMLLYKDETRYVFVTYTKAFPLCMSFFKFAVLATMGELLAKRLVEDKWVFKGTFWYYRAFVWGMLGVLFSFVFPIYSTGIDYLVLKGRLITVPGFQLLSIAFWKSFWMNMLFAMPMMIFHRITDMLIDRNSLFKKWPFMTIWNEINWKNMWGLVAPSIIWFWIPAHTVTFYLAPEYRLLMAAGLSICLGAILAFAKKKAV